MALEGFAKTGYSMWRNVAIGISPMVNAYNDFGDVAIGFNVLQGAYNGDFNTCVGDAACQDMTFGAANTALGRGACEQETSGAYDVCVGHAAGVMLTTGGEDVFLGDVACDSGLTTASNVTCLGAETTNSGNYSNSTAVGFGAAITAVHQVVLGTSAETVILPGPSQRTTIYSAAGTPVPTCNSGAEGMEVGVSDATTVTYRATYVSGGSNIAKLFCTGSAWLVS
jgi:hypothetical protein